MKAVASRLWLFGWIAAWVFSSRKVALSPESASLIAFLFGATGFLFGLYLFFRGFEQLQRKRWLEDTPITKISAAAIGPVKVFGKASGPYTSDLTSRRGRLLLLPGGSLGRTKRAG